MPAPNRIAGVVLAAGSSSRMGRNKLLLELGGETLVRRVVGRALAAGLDPVFVVLGHESDRVLAELEGLPCRPLFNASHARGVRTSLQTGVYQAAAHEADALVVILADMPHVSAEMIATLVEHYRAARPLLVVSSYGDVDAPPILYSRALFGDLLAIPEDRCAKQVVRRYRAEAVAVSWPPGSLRDIDVAEDYDEVRAHLP
jgi:molybdenum cofactor cytidylyltransferase